MDRERPDDRTDATSRMSDADRASLRDRVIEVLRTCYDPEIPVDIYELGLIYDVLVDDRGQVDVKMTLTSPACPVAGSLPGEVEIKVQAIEGVARTRVELVWDPPWDQDRMSDAAKLTLGLL
jgi:FeS assembly SUF system protein